MQTPARPWATFHGRLLPVDRYVIQDLLFKYVNPTMARLFGYTPQEVEGRLGPLDLIVPEQRDLIRKNLIERAQGVPGQPYEIQGLRKDGSVFDALESLL